jgi:hypothetical protein
MQTIAMPLLERSEKNGHHRFNKLPSRSSNKMKILGFVCSLISQGGIIIDDNN